MVDSDDHLYFHVECDSLVILWRLMVLLAVEDEVRIDLDVL